jgi:hypothetical protein
MRWLEEAKRFAFLCAYKALFGFDWEVDLLTETRDGASENPAVEARSWHRLAALAWKRLRQSSPLKAPLARSAPARTNRGHQHGAVA